MDGQAIVRLGEVGSVILVLMLTRTFGNTSHHTCLRKRQIDEYGSKKPFIYMIIEKNTKLVTKISLIFEEYVSTFGTIDQLSSFI